MSAAAAASPGPNPFPGLRPFREDEEHLFFGRENQVDAMVDKLADTRFLAVVGTSGSGKSSLVNCGLRPALRQGLMSRAGTAWRMAQFRPGSNPIGAIARALAQDGVLFREPGTEGVTLAEIIDTTLRMSKLGLIDIYEMAPLDEGVNMLVVVDQFEELFRYRQLEAAGRRGDQHNSEEAAAFVNLLLEVKQQKTCPIFVVLTMRSDFLGDCTQFPGLAEAINAGQYLVPRMTRDERRAAIEGPVRVGGAEIAPVLLTRLVNDVGDNPDQLSILQHALNRTWARWQDDGGEGPLDLAHYEAIGTMANALDQHAEQAYSELGTTRLEQVCEKLFKALTDKATDSRGVRRPTTLPTLCALAEATDAEVTPVIDVFRDPSRSFLMPPAGEALGADTVIDISHESLMRVWRRLDSWADEEARSAQTYSRLADAAGLHQAGAASLWRDPELQLTLDWREKTQPNETWASRYHPGFGEAMRFLTESSDAREAERAERQRQRQREREDEQQKAEAQARHSRLRHWAYSIGVAGALGILLLVIFWQHQLNSQKAVYDRQAHSRELAAAAQGKLERDAELGTLLAIEAVRATSSAGEPVTDQAGDLLRKIISSPHAEKRLGGLVSLPRTMFFSPDGIRLVATSGDFTRARDAASGSFVPIFRATTLVWMVEGKPVNGLISPDAQRVATATSDNAVRVSDAASEKEIFAVAHNKAVSAVVFSPDGQRLATASIDGNTKVSDAISGGQLFNLDARENKIYSPMLSYNPNSKWLAVQDKSENTVIVVETNSGKEVFREVIPGVSLMTINEDGTLLATITKDNVTLWEISSQKPFPLSGRYNVVAFSPDGNFFAASGEGPLVQLWHVNIGEAVKSWRTLRGQTGAILDVVFSPDSSKIATVSSDGTAKIWAVNSSKQLLSLKDADAAIKKVAFSRDGTTVATAAIPSSATATGPSVSLWNVGSHPDPYRVAFSADGSRLATSGADGMVRIWDAYTQRALGPPLGPQQGQIWGLAFSPDGRKLATANNEGQGSIWDLTPDRYKTEFRTDLTESVDLVWADEKSIVVTGGKDAEVAGGEGTKRRAKVYSSNGSFLRAFGGTMPAEAVALSSDGHHLGIINKTRDKLEIRDDGIDQPRSISAKGRGESGKDLTFEDAVLSPNGKYVAVVSNQGLIFLWDGQSPELHPLRANYLAYIGDTETPYTNSNGIAFSPHGKYLAAAYPNTIVVWDIVAAGNPFFIRVENVATLAFSPDDKRLATVSKDGSWQVWLLEAEDLIETARRLTKRVLKAEECKIYQVEPCPQPE